MIDISTEELANHEDSLAILALNCFWLLSMVLTQERGWFTDRASASPNYPAVISL